jgi:hypothetical protein
VRNPSRARKRAVDASQLEREGIKASMNQLCESHDADRRFRQAGASRQGGIALTTGRMNETAP